MSQQVWAFFASNEPGASESWTIRWLAHKLGMPESTVRGQIRRLERDGKVVRRHRSYGGRILFRAATKDDAP